MVNCIYEKREAFGLPLFFGLSKLDSLELSSEDTINSLIAVTSRE
jgi:hypothetical protein